LPELRELLTDSARGEGAVGREVFLALADTDAAGVVSAFDAIEALWFEALDGVDTYLSGVACERDRASVAGVVQGTERVAASIKVVV
jgi:hypothetical protein